MSVLTGVQPERAFDDAFRRIERLEQGITTPGYTGSGDNAFETIVIGPPGSQVTLSVATPPAPGNIVVTPGAFGPRSFVDASWDAATDAVSYQAELATNTAGVRAIVDQATGVPRNVRFDNLDRSKNYSVRVASLNRLGITGAFSAWVDFTPLVDPFLPATVTGLTVFRGAASLIATWNASADVDVANGNGLYKVQRATNNTFTTNLDEKLTSATVIAFDGITAEQTWYVRVAAIDSSGNQSAAWSVVVSTTAGGITGTMVLPSTIPSDKLTLGPPGDNMVANGSFEGTVYQQGANFFPESWGYLDAMAAGIGVTVTVSIPKRLNITPTASAPARVYGKGFTVVAGQTYYFSCKYMAQTTVASGIYVQAVIKSVLDEYRYLNVVQDIVLVNNAGGTAGTWVTVEGQFTPTQSGFCMMALISNTNGPVLNFDDIVVSKPATTASIANNAITAGQIAANTITAGQIAANTLTANEIAANAITTSELSATAITASHIASNLIVASHIAAGQITTAHMTVGTINGDRITANTMAVSKLLADSILANNINIGAGGQFKVGNPPSGAGAVFNTQGLSVYNTSGTRTIFLNFADGSGTFTGAISGSTISGSTISGSTISGSTISGGIITGSTFQTNTSGARIVISSGLQGSGAGAYSDIGFWSNRTGGDNSSAGVYVNHTVLGSSWGDRNQFSLFGGTPTSSQSSAGIFILSSSTGPTVLPDQIHLDAELTQLYGEVLIQKPSGVFSNTQPAARVQQGLIQVVKDRQGGDGTSLQGWDYQGIRVSGQYSAGYAYHSTVANTAGILKWNGASSDFYFVNSPDTAAVAIWASAFNINSSERIKSQIGDSSLDIHKFSLLKVKEFVYTGMESCALCNGHSKTFARGELCPACGTTGDSRSDIAKRNQSGRKIGLVAEDLYAVYPDLVQLNEEGRPQGIGLDQLVALLFQKCLVQDAEVKELQEKVNALEAQR